MKIKIVESWFNEETGVSKVVINTDRGIFCGTAQLHEEDRDIASNFAGCEYAEMRAIVKYFKRRAKDTQIKITGLQNYEKRLLGRKDYQKHSVENRQLRKYMKQLEQEKIDWEEKASSLENKIQIAMKNREKMVREMTKKSEE